MDVSNFSLVDQSVVADVRLHKPVWYAHFIMTSTMDKSPYRAAVLHLSRTDLVQVNPPTMSERGFVFPLRVSDRFVVLIFLTAGLDSARLPGPRVVKPCCYVVR